MNLPEWVYTGYSLPQYLSRQPFYLVNGRIEQVVTVQCPGLGYRSGAGAEEGRNGGYAKGIGKFDKAAIVANDKAGTGDHLK
jgi:hypothetical protein